MSDIFTRLAPYGYIHHRALNDFEEMAHAERCIIEHPDKAQVLEGDVCWDFADGRSEIYFRHPSLFVDTLSPRQIAEQRRARKLVAMEDLLARDTPKHHYVLELKVGAGDTTKALTSIVETMQKHCPNRFWIDGFSYRLLTTVKQIDATVRTTVHTEHVENGRILLDAPEWPPFRKMNLSDLKHVDGIALRKRFSDDYMTRACADIHKAGFKLLLSRLFTVADYRMSRELGAIAGYPKAAFEEIMRADVEDNRRPTTGLAQ